MELVTTLEERFGAWLGSNVAMCSSGTSALHLALVALGIGPGDEVIVPEFTMIACANAVSYTGATPVFVDCKTNFQINENLIEKEVTRHTKAIMVAHIYNNLCNMEAIKNIAKRHNLFIVEDAAEAHGAEYKGQKAGTLGHVSTFSFYKNKIIHAEEGGAVVSKSEKVIEKVKALRCHDFSSKHDFIHQRIGFNYRMPESQARMILDQDWDALVAERKNPDGTVNWVYPEVFDSKEKRDRAYIKYEKEGKNPRYFFRPMSEQPPYQKQGRVYSTLLAYKLSRCGLYLPHGIIQT